MKKIPGFVVLTTLVLLAAACNDEKTKETTTKTTTQPTTRSAPAEKNTVINVDDRGIKVSTKKVDVNYSPKKN